MQQLFSKYDQLSLSLCLFSSHGTLLDICLVHHKGFYFDQKQVLKIWESYVAELYDRANRPENLNVEPEEEVGEDHKGPHILRSEVE
jgi:hypothetical protein